MTFKRKRLIYGILLALSLPLIYLWSLNLNFEKRDLQTIIGTLSKKPELNYSTRGSSLKIHLSSFQTNFQTDVFAYNALKGKELICTLKVGDTIFINIKSDASLSFVDIINRWLGKTSIMEVWTKDFRFLSMEEYNEHRQKDSKYSYLFWVFGVVVYLFWNFRRAGGTRE